MGPLVASKIDWERSEFSGTQRLALNSFLPFDMWPFKKDGSGAIVTEDGAIKEF